MSVFIPADAADIDCAKQIELEYMSVDDLKKGIRPNIRISSLATHTGMYSL